MEQSGLSHLNANAIEVHYWFKDDTHTMDAFVQNKCEYDLLGVLKNIANILELEIIIETEPLGDGGLIRVFKVVSKIENSKGLITSGVIIALITGFFISPLSTALNEYAKLSVDKYFEDTVKKNLDYELEKLQIENLREEIKTKAIKLDGDTVIIKKRSNFYEELEKYSKIEKVSYQVQDDKGKPMSDSFVIDRPAFKGFILASDKLEPLKLDNVEIEIISPVLKKGNYKWRGIYKGEPILFNMKSNEYKTKVQIGEIEFKNGSSINCYLEVERELNNEGKEVVMEYNILRVNKYFVNDKPFETQEGKQHRQKQEADKNQLKMFGENE